MKHTVRNRKWLTRVLIILGIASILTGVTACGRNTKNTDILTQKTIEKGRTPITILVKYAFSINSFEAAVEEKFPDIDIVQVGNFTRDMGIAEYESRIEHDDLTDIVMTWPLEVGEAYWEDRLLDLSGMEFTNGYNISMLNTISRNGKLYYLPGPAQVRGLIYNKTLFEENGWDVPKNYEEFVELCYKIEEKGIKALQLGFQNSEVLDTAFVGLNYGSYYSKPQDTQWLADYNNGKGSFGEHFDGALDIFQRMIDEGIFTKEDLEIDYAEREKMLFTRQCAMVEDSVLMARMGYSATGTTDEFALMPFFNPGNDGDWARLYMVCYIGLNKHLAEPQNKEKYELVMKLMEYISTKEGQEMLAGDTGAMFSSLSGTEPPDIMEVKELVTALSHGRYAVFPTLKNAQGALREGLAGMIRGDISKEEVIKMVDTQNLNPEVAAPPEKLGTATKDFTMIETGNYVTDVLREWGGTDISLFMDNGKDGRYNGKGISARLYEGDVTVLDLKRILPDIKHGETGTLWKVTMTGANLINTLEYSIPVDNNVTGWFYYFSGLRMEYNPLAEPGKRIRKVTLSDGSPVEPDKLYSIAVMDETLPEEYIQSCEKTDVTIMDILYETIKTEGTISPSKDGRFTVVK